MTVKKLSSKKQSVMSCMDGAYVSGLLMGWASRLEKNSKSVKDVINEMGKFSKELAERSGVTLFDKGKN